MSAQNRGRQPPINPLDPTDPGNPGSGGPPGNTTPPGGPGSDPSNQSPPAPSLDLSQFLGALPDVQKTIFEQAGGYGGGIMYPINALGQISGGQQTASGGLLALAGQGWDPFTQQQMAQFDVLGNQRKQATLDQLARQGLTGSAAASTLDQQGVQTDAQRMALSGQLGQAGLNFQADTTMKGVMAGSQAAQTAGLQGGMMDLRQKMLESGLQNYLAAPAMQTAYAAATKPYPNLSGKGK